MILFGCLFAFAIATLPRFMLILGWIFGPRWDLVWEGNWIMPLLGIIFAPYTTIMYLLVWSPTGLHGFDWGWVLLGVFLDLMKWAQVYQNRQGIPGQGSAAQPATVAATAGGASQSTAAPAPVAKAETSVESELDSLANLRDKGILTEEEYQAKKAQLKDV